MVVDYGLLGDWESLIGVPNTFGGEIIVVASLTIMVLGFMVLTIMIPIYLLKR